LFFYKKIF